MAVVAKTGKIYEAPSLPKIPKIAGNTWATVARNGHKKTRVIPSTTTLLAPIGTKKDMSGTTSSPDRNPSDKRLFVGIPVDREWRKLSPTGIREVIVKKLSISPSLIGKIKPVHSGFALSPCSSILVMGNIGTFILPLWRMNGYQTEDIFLSRDHLLFRKLCREIVQCTAELYLRGKWTSVYTTSVPCPIQFQPYCNWTQSHNSMILSVLCYSTLIFFPTIYSCIFWSFKSGSRQQRQARIFHANLSWVFLYSTRNTTGSKT